MKPTVSILMPVFNVERTLAEALSSMLNQTFTDFELLLIDDASTDRTIEIAESFADQRIRVIRKPANKGLVDSLNAGLALSRGEFVARMDGDDISLPTRLEQQVAFLTKHPEISIVGSWFQLMPGDEVVRTHASAQECRVWLLKKSVVGHPTVMFRKADLDAAGLRYNPVALHAEDYQLWIDAEMAGLNIANCAEVLLHYRVHPAQLSVVHSERQSTELNRIRTNYWKHLFPVSTSGSEDIIYQLTTARYSDYRSYSAARRLGRSLIRENQSTRVVDEAALKNFVHMNLARGAAEIYKDLGVGGLVKGLFDPYFFRTIAGKIRKQISV